MSIDPLTLVYNTIVSEFQKDYNNVVSYNTTRQPKPDVLTESDAPELIVMPDSATVVLGNASCETTVEKTYQVAVNTGDQRLGEIAFPTMWQLLKTYQRLRYGSVMNSLQYNSRTFIEDCWTGSATYELGAAERGLFGWSCLWPVIVRMSFSPEDLA
jgi:hypothetical protein